MCERRRSEDHEKPTEKDEMESELTHLGAVLIKKKNNCPKLKFEVGNL